MKEQGLRAGGQSAGSRPAHDDRLSLRQPFRLSRPRDADRHRARPRQPAHHPSLRRRQPGLPRPQVLPDQRAVHAAGHPLLHPRRQLHDDRRGGAPHDRLRDRLPRPFPGRPGHGLGAGLHALRRRLRQLARDRGGDRLDRHRRHGPDRLQPGLRGRRHLQRRHARHPDPALDRHGGLCGRHRQLGRPPIHGRGHSRASFSA